ncbi:hypothetical protein K469DRAFT_235683 [Zopfia rhizophila CBS 207.26]|uniref:Uncharacterized protein n=1 Tax=Zopfia rhizophila CBS 207.26 TaxID=1314779 RepID=A0A6A6ERQ6_9PEZI|nr:hypothetical protein K469DRAFT_235683 [Zopfia rhizophila CBS 207.26]
MFNLHGTFLFYAGRKYTRIEVFVKPHSRALHLFFSSSLFRFLSPVSFFLILQKSYGLRAIRTPRPSLKVTVSLALHLSESHSLLSQNFELTGIDCYNFVLRLSPKYAVDGPILALSPWIRLSDSA